MRVSMLFIITPTTKETMPKESFQKSLPVLSFHWVLQQEAAVIQETIIIPGALNLLHFFQHILFS